MTWDWQTVCVSLGAFLGAFLGQKASKPAIMAAIREHQNTCPYAPKKGSETA